MGVQLVSSPSITPVPVTVGPAELEGKRLWGGVMEGGDNEPSLLSVAAGSRPHRFAGQRPALMIPESHCGDRVEI